MKDLFSARSAHYQKFRPDYPDALFAYLYQQQDEFDTAWDVGTGNGQVAVRLAEQFRQVYASDISKNQLAQAPRRINIDYRQVPAEQSQLPAQSVSLITVAQALHWFDFTDFYAELNRVAKPGGKIAVWGYGLLEVKPEVDAVIAHFYHEILGPFWDKERRHIDSHYRDIPFPFDEQADVPTFHIEKKWELDELLGYLSTWSAVKNYRTIKQEDPLTDLRKLLKHHWQEVLSVSWPIFLRIGKVSRT